MIISELFDWNLILYRIEFRIVSSFFHSNNKLGFRVRNSLKREKLLSKLTIICLRQVNKEILLVDGKFIHIEIQCVIADIGHYISD